MINAGFEPDLCLEVGGTGSHEEEDPRPPPTVGTQTDNSPTILSSWKILRANNTVPGLNTSSGSAVSDYVVIETSSWGFDASTQTRDAELFRYSEAKVRDMVMAWRMITLFLPCTWYLIMYVTDQLTDVVVTAEFCSSGESWWCGLSVTFLVLPSLFISGYAYEQLTQPDIASVAPLNKWFASIARKVSWCYRAWRSQSWLQNKRQSSSPPSSSSSPPPPTSSSTQPQRQPVVLRRTPKELWEQASAETESSTVKWFQSLLESVPQLSLQTYVLMEQIRRYQDPDHEQGVVSAALVASALVSLTSASSGLASVLSERAWERVAASVAIFLTLGSRVLVSGGVGTIHQALWFVPVLSATFIGLVTKMSETKEETWAAVLTKTHKYSFESFLMATVCPPFNALGLFTSVPYVLAGMCYLTLDPGCFVNIMVFVLSILGQVAWLALGFFTT
ncbi:uncharacterized protein LOC125033560 isoform X2 [Penaeus chinensis]|uniref:uncharacterized protein LOC125033560 isoform X2 n=1 Tax=Penaeus chinensis TaxID=139456 RepID=UPI001FB8055B|nr:uncharacterized protein LOC125033560 isoform X2 [Penaeus chinensis]